MHIFSSAQIAQPAVNARLDMYERKETHAFLPAELLDLGESALGGGAGGALALAAPSPRGASAGGALREAVVRVDVLLVERVVDEFGLARAAPAAVELGWVGGATPRGRRARRRALLAATRHGHVPGGTPRWTFA